ncbi:putative kinase [Paenibacillus endophyticus]|uniref:Putative kinase n=1 Tax=Paenibacillus endophyticus TaxID=1294268 RepID=A0A7W5CAA8_9BACL|nr:hypothetical protein [Paenibacillus endophyticus]MBB3153034.1 putative kinase [Paenibacillus endophyticus]
MIKPFDENLTNALCAKQSLVDDNTNPTKLDRQKYMDAASGHGYKIIGYFFEPNIDESLIRNELRNEREMVPIVGIKSTLGKLQRPEFANAVTITKKSTLASVY